MSSHEESLAGAINVAASMRAKLKHGTWAVEKPAWNPVVTDEERRLLALGMDRCEPVVIETPEAESEIVAIAPKVVVESTPAVIGSSYFLDVSTGVAEVDIVLETAANNVPNGPHIRPEVVVKPVRRIIAKNHAAATRQKLETVPKTSFASLFLMSLICGVILLFTGMASIDLVRSMWGYQGYSPANGWLIETLGRLFK